MPGHELGIIAPHVTAVASGQVGTHSHMFVAGLQRWPAGQSVPVPVHDIPPQVSRIGEPHITADGAGHMGAHSHRPVVALQRWPAAQRVPVPHDGPPGQTLGMSMPHAVAAGVVAGQRG
jgi:hypothetical protein